MIEVPPEITRGSQFLGSTGVTSGDFPHDDEAILAAGPGRIIGSVLAEEKPLAGLRLRLALNGSALSQWATTGADGRYEIAVPYGNYRIDGYRLDWKNANALLPGLINRPQMPYTRAEFEVTADGPRQGLDFEFVAPVVLDMHKTSYPADEDIVIHWQAYPGAEAYLVAIYQVTGHGKSQSIFAGPDRPVTSEPHLNLADHEVTLKPNRSYWVEVEARGRDQQAISRTARPFAGYHFEVVE